MEPLAAERKKTRLFLNNTSTVFTLIVLSFSAHKNLVESDSEALMLHFTILDFRRSQCIPVMISNKYLPHLFLLLPNQDLFFLNRTP